MQLSPRLRQGTPCISAWTTYLVENQVNQRQIIQKLREKRSLTSEIQQIWENVRIFFAHYEGHLKVGSAHLNLICFAPNNKIISLATASSSTLCFGKVNLLPVLSNVCAALFNSYSFRNS